jgi:hypothetical protein
VRSSRLLNLVFEPRSNLREIEPGAFAGCGHLKRICIPASVEKMTVNSLPPSHYTRNQVESENSRFVKQDYSLIDLNEHSLLRQWNRALEVTVPDDIETIEEECFLACKAMRHVKLGPLSKLSSIGESGFRDCVNLKTMTIPVSVSFLGGHCFEGCVSLQMVIFDPASKLDYIPDSAFAQCGSLASIVLPSSVKTLGRYCFSGCAKLAQSPFPHDSEIVRIEEGAFGGCSSLPVLLVPSSVEFVGEFCFVNCHALLRLEFAAPSHLRGLLDLPPCPSGYGFVPDSVEYLAFCGAAKFYTRSVFAFGSESKLRSLAPRSLTHGVLKRSFLQVRTSSLKNLRANLEFADG